MATLSYSESKSIMEIARRFDIPDGRIDKVKLFEGGRINQTYMITVRGKQKRYEYLLQTINHEVFSNVNGLMGNIIWVTNYIAQNGGKALQFIPCRKEFRQDDLAIYVLAFDNKYWRMYHFIEADVYSCITNIEDARKLGKEIAQFAYSLRDFDAKKLVETIPDFHNTPKRFNDLLYSVASDTVMHIGRVKGIEHVLQFVFARKERFGVLMDALAKGEIPYRVVHNDPKITNVLFDKETGEPICMIDLDTIMPGTCLFDVGDALRSIANTASEDDKDISNVSFSVDIYHAFVEGYLEGMGDSITRKEKELIPISIWVIAMELGIRFLKDHIDGNKYFKTEYDGQNLERARIQFALARSIEETMEMDGDYDLYSVLKLPEPKENILKFDVNTLK